MLRPRHLHMLFHARTFLPGWHKNGIMCPSSSRLGTSTFGAATPLFPWSTILLKTQEFSGSMLLGLRRVSVVVMIWVKSLLWERNRVRRKTTLTWMNFGLDFGTFLGPVMKINNIVQVKEETKKHWRTRNLGFAKHRHSSILKPASRMVLHTSAIILAAMESLVVIDWHWWVHKKIYIWCHCQFVVGVISLRVCQCQWLQASFGAKPWKTSSPRILERRTNPKVKARVTSFLENVNAESIIQLAMLCDAAQEELELSLVSKICHLSLTFWLAILFDNDSSKTVASIWHLKDPLLWQEHGGRSATPFWNGWLLEQDLGFVPSKESRACPLLHSPCFSSKVNLTAWRRSVFLFSF